MEELIMEEVREVVDWLKKEDGKKVELQRRFSLAVVNSIWRILSGERYDHDDEKLISILEQLDR
jgi:NTP pyrophosphatase (non-canonical NTP hydrolase)